MVLKCGRARGAAARTEGKERANLSFNIERGFGVEQFYFV